MKQLECSLGMNVDQIIALLGSNMYNGDVVNNIVKELVQNSFDAVKIQKIMDASHKGRIEVNLSSGKRTIQVRDNGIGMSPEVVEKAFFVIGGSYKGDNIANDVKSGGLGFAKVLFLFSSEGLKVTTVHNGIKTTFETNPDEIKDSRDGNSRIKLNVAPTDEYNGTSVEVKIPETYVDNNGERQTIYFGSSPSFLNKTMIGDVEVVVNGNSSYKDKAPSKYLYVGRATSAFGELDLYIAPCKGGRISTEVLISGLYQFDKRIWVDGNQGLDVICNILPSVGVQDRLYPINNQRQGFRSTVMPEVNDLEALFKRIHKAYVNGQYAAAFSSCLSMDVRKLSDEKRVPHEGTLFKQAIARAIGEPVKEDEDFKPFVISFKRIKEIIEEGRSSSLDTSGIHIPDIPVVDTSTLDINKPVFHNNTSMKMDDNASKVLKEFGALLLELKDLYIQTWGSNTVMVNWSEVSIRERMSSQFWGISLDKNYLGVNVNPRMFDFLGVNPFGFSLPQQEGINQALVVTECVTHAIIHEVNHIYASGEGDTFTARLIHTEAEFTAIGFLYADWKRKLFNLVNNNLETFSKCFAAYRESSNVSASLQK